MTLKSSCALFLHKSPLLMFTSIFFSLELLSVVSLTKGCPVSPPENVLVHYLLGKLAHQLPQKLLFINKKNYQPNSFQHQGPAQIFAYFIVKLAKIIHLQITSPSPLIHLPPGVSCICTEVINHVKDKDFILTELVRTVLYYGCKTHHL